MNILITGASGFLGRILKCEFDHIRGRKDVPFLAEGDICIMECNSKTTDVELKEYCKRADIIYHFAAVMRPSNIKEFETVNVGLTKKIIAFMGQSERVKKIIFASSLQANMEGRFTGSDYGKSKKEAEMLLCDFAEHSQIEVLIYRFPCIFGKGSRPNYSSVVATFCYNISRNFPIWINDAAVEIELVYVDDFIKEMILLLNGQEHIAEDFRKGKKWRYCYIPEKYYITVGELANLLQDFKKLRDQLKCPNIDNLFVRKMWNTYLSYLPEE